MTASHRGNDQHSWPEPVKDIRYLSSADATQQPALFYSPDAGKDRPLLVALHTWSNDYLETRGIPYANWCIQHEWCFMHPNFRGPNVTPEATGSQLVVKDIASAVDHARRNGRVDSKRIYLVGFSGGGHAALLMAGRAPGIWAGISSWAADIDLEDFYYETKRAGMANYCEQVVKSCGGVPGDSSKVDYQYKLRSPITHLSNGKDIAIDINAGILDKWQDRAIPVRYALKAFNILAADKDKVAEDDIEYFVEKGEVPSHLTETLNDPLYQEYAPLFRRASENARVTIFKCGHGIVYNAALTWLSQQTK